jgi:hypothetical protein
VYLTAAVETSVDLLSLYSSFECKVNNFEVFEAVQVQTLNLIGEI